jgi:hypothetical protein
MEEHGLVVPDTRLARSHGMHGKNVEPGDGDTWQ